MQASSERIQPLPPARRQGSDVAGSVTDVRGLITRGNQTNTEE